VRPADLVELGGEGRAEARLRESEARYRSLVEVVPDGVVVLREGRIEFANDALARILGAQSAAELNGRSFLDLFAEADRPDVAARLAQWERELGSGGRFERQLLALDGRAVYADIGGASFERGEATYVQAIVRDNTVRRAIHRRVLEINVELERRIAERTADLQAANRELEAFSYSVAHDLRAPLRAIDGFARILAADLEGKLDASAQRSLDRIHANVRHVSQLVDDLLALARIGRLEVNRTAIDTAALCRDVCEELRPAFPCSAIATGELPVVQGDPMLLRQVFVNLVGNALKFSARVERPRVEVGHVRAHGEHVFHVRDNGVGFSMDYAHKLFGVFQRLHARQEFDGTGVGLAIVQRALHRLGGRAWATAEPGKGATFHFALPA
jgi:PAS domain S-box-containing protein